MNTQPAEAQMLRSVEGAFASLPDQYVGAGRDFRAAFRIELEDLGISRGVELGAESCELLDSPPRNADTVIETDSASWLELREGRLSGLDAFCSQRLRARGNVDLAVAFEGFFRPPDGRSPLPRLHEVEAGKARISTLSVGTGVETVVLIHGLGGSKSNFYETVAALAPRHTVHAIDLPGFGSSSKPARAPYDPAWFSRAVVRFLDTMSIRRAHLVGNSLGGRIAIEVGLTAPERVGSLSLLTPSMAWRKRRELVPLARLVRPELAAIPHAVPSPLVRRQFGNMFAKPERLHPSFAEVGVEEFRRTYRGHAARVALSAAARHIYLDKPDGPGGFWRRLGGLQPPALFIWGDEDPLVPHTFGRHVSDALPQARQVVMEECGHVPQVELPEDANRMIIDFIASARSSHATRTVARIERARKRLRATPALVRLAG